MKCWTAPNSCSSTLNFNHYFNKWSAAKLSVNCISKNVFNAWKLFPYAFAFNEAKFLPLEPLPWRTLIPTWWCFQHLLKESKFSPNCQLLSHHPVNCQVWKKSSQMYMICFTGIRKISRLQTTCLSRCPQHFICACMAKWKVEGQF